MSKPVDVTVPDIGDFADVPVIEILVSKGEQVAVEQSLLTLESDKATIEIPSPLAGEVVELLVEVGSTVSEGSLIARINASGEAGEKTTSDAPEQTASAEASPPDSASDSAPQSSENAAAGEVASASASAVQQPANNSDQAVEAPAAPAAQQTGEHEFDVLVLGSGPGGYTAAFRAADLGLKVALVERYPTLGGVCLNVGCIPSKTLLHTAQIIDEAAAMSRHGVQFGDPQIDLAKLGAFKDGVVGKLTGGLARMAEMRKVEVIQGEGVFTGPHEVSVEHQGKTRTVGFAQAIIAVGSQSFELPGLPWGDPRLMDSTDALKLEEIPPRLLVIGGGIIGLEMACVYAALGSRVTVVELAKQLMPGADPDLLRPLQQRISKRYENIYLETRVTQVDIADDALVARFDGKDAPASDSFDRILVAVGRVPNGNRIAADAAGVKVTDRGFIEVDNQMRTNVPHIFAIGDVIGQPMLAHKATHEGKVAAEVCAGEKSAFEARVIPSVAYTDPEVAWVGLTETEARQAGVKYEVGKLPWVASARALGIDRPEGFTKLLFDPETNRVLGAGIVGPHAGDLISEVALAIEMGCEAADIGLTIHPHPTLSESIGMAAEAFEGTITDLYQPKKKSRKG